jgi:hypothetical protein
MPGRFCDILQERGRVAQATCLFRLATCQPEWNDVFDGRKVAPVPGVAALRSAGLVARRDGQVARATQTHNGLARGAGADYKLRAFDIILTCNQTNFANCCTG